MSPKEIAELTIRSLYKEAPACILASAYLELEKKLSLEQQDRESEKRESKVFKDAAEKEITKLKKSREGLREAVKFNADLVTWCDDNNQKIILTYGYGVEKAREAIKADDEIMGCGE